MTVKRLCGYLNALESVGLGRLTPCQLPGSSQTSTITAMHSWVIPGEPIGKGRAHVFRNKYTGRVHGVTPEKTRDWEAKAVEVFACHWDGAPADTAVYLDIVAVFARPKRLEGKRSPSGRIPHDVKPDFDNVSKAVGDSMEKARVISNDSLVAGAVVRKFFVSRGEEPHVEVRMSTQFAEINFDEIPF